MHRINSIDSSLGGYLLALLTAKHSTSLQLPLEQGVWPMTKDQQEPLLQAM